MVDGGDDEAGIGERLGRVVMADEVAALTCEMTTRGSLSPSIGQSFTPGSVLLPTITSFGGVEQGDHTAPVNAGPRSRQAHQ